jgi:hypothetical protein
MADLIYVSVPIAFFVIGALFVLHGVDAAPTRT